MSSAEAIPAMLESAALALRSNVPEAFALAERAVAAAISADDAISLAAAYRLMGQAHRALGRHEEAIAVFERAAQAARMAGDSLLEARVQIGSIDSLGMVGRYEEGVLLANRLESVFREAGSEVEAAKVLANAGSLSFRRDHYVEALESYQKAAESFLRVGDTVSSAFLKTNCANALTALNRIEEGMQLYSEAREIFHASELTIDRAVVDVNIGFLHSVSGRYTAAISILTQAQQAFQLAGRELEMARSLVDRGYAYLSLNLYEESLADFENAIAVFERLPNDYDRARSELGRAAALLATEQFSEAETALASAELVFRSQKNQIQLAHTQLIRAARLRQAGDNVGAQQESMLAERSFRRNGLRGWAAEAKFILAEIALEQDGEGARAMTAVCRTAREYARGWLECRSERALGRYYARKNDIGRALRRLRAGARVLEEARTLIAPEEMHIAFLRDKLGIYDDIVGLLLARGSRRDISEALVFVERAKSRMLLERMLKIFDGDVTPVASMARQRLATLRTELHQEYYRANRLPEGEPRRFLGSPAPAGSALHALESTYRQALREVELSDESSNSRLITLSPRLSVQKLKGALLPDEMLLEYCVVQGSLWAFVMTQNSLEVFPLGIRLEEAAYLHRKLRFHLQRIETPKAYLNRHRSQLEAGCEETLGRLYDALLLPLEGHLTTEKIILIPHDVLHGLPFHAFFDGRHHALDRWEFLYNPSAAIWYEGRQRTQCSTSEATCEPILLTAVPHAGIAGVRKEVESVAELFPNSTVLQDGKATLAAFRENAPRFRTIHLATHALFRADNPLFSGLRFEDGWLLAHDLYEMTLSCDLATLSACHTGALCVESGDEVFGLIRGFLASGARSVAASLWSANDSATTELMTGFYTYLSEGQSKGAALRAAQRDLRSRYPHPYYWAAFGLIGER